MILKNPLKMATEGCDCEALDEDKKFDRLDKILNLYKNEKGNLISSLYVAQGIFGYLPKNVIRFVSKKLEIPVITVLGVATFYSFFNKFPKGKYTVKVCLGTACYVRGGKALLDKMKKELGIMVGETSADGMFSLDVVRCIGACALAPVMVINNETHKRVKVNTINSILDIYREKSGGTPKKGARNDNN
jgi:NADH:ubiquinone oxidoreductase subunit E